MFGVRDVLWSFLICALLTLFFQYRPAYEARRFVERDSRLGFAEVYAGHRFMNGDLIEPYASGGVNADPNAAAVISRAFEIEAQSLDWSGKHAEFVVHHAIQLETERPGDGTSRDVHLQLEKQAGAWGYTLFEVAGGGALAAPNEGNPWARALRAPRANKPRSTP